MSFRPFGRSPSAARSKTLPASDRRGAANRTSRKRRRLFQLETLEPRIVLAAEPVINEFMAANTNTLADNEGEFNDWIEIYNRGDAAVNLDGWFLTDDAGELAKWEFPAEVLDPGEYLVVFASNKNRATAGQQLHTNFRLSAEGELLALVMPDGETVVSSFVPTFPQQIDNVSYGTATDIATFPMVQATADAKVNVPASGALGTTWTAPAFNDVSWQTAITGIGYAATATPPPFGDFIQTNLQAQMYQQRAGAYARIPFNLGTVPNIDTLKLHMKFDDGFVAYLNGVEIARSNIAPGTPAWNSTSISDRADASAITFQEFDVSGFIDELVDGTNILAIHGLNSSVSAADTGFLILPELIGSRTIGSETAFMSTPTPGAANVVGFAGLGAGPTFSQTTGTFSTNFNLVLTNNDPSAVIRFTVDGTQPTASSQIYSGPIPITNTTQVRARAFPAGFLPSPVVSHTFYKLAADVQGFNSNLPIVVIDNFNQGAVPTETPQSGYMAIFEPGENGRSSIGDLPTTISRTGLRIRGSSTAGDPKHQYKLETWDDQNNDRAIPILGMPEESDWVLFASYNFDRAMMRNDFIYQLSNEMGDYAVRTRFVEVFLNLNGGEVTQGDYIGVYSFMESIKRDEDRVDIDPLLPGDTTAPDITGGYIVKIDRCDPGDSGFTGANQGMCFVEPDETTLEQAAWDPQEQYIRNYINQFGTALNGANFANPTTGYAAYLDVERSIDHHMLNVLAMNVDALRLSTYLYKPRDGKLTFGPVWDFDRAMESTDGRDDNPSQWNGPPDSTIYFTSDSRNIWWGRLFQDPNFWQKWIDRWQELRETTLSTAHMHAVLDFNRDTLAEAAARNFVRWSAAPPRGGSHASEVQIMKNWLATRAAWIDGRFTRKATLSSPGGIVAQGFQVTLTGPAGATLYYTTDGSDPRASGGGISPTALVYSGPITINDNTRITVRARAATQLDGSPWSGPTTGDYYTDRYPLAVSEVHYNPAPPSAAELAAGYAADDFEFIEVQNIRNRPLNITGYKFTSGVEFTFGNVTIPVGGRAVVARNSAAYAMRYPAAPAPVGQYGNIDPLLDFQLSNDSEQVVLKDKFGGILEDFTYADNWHSLTDGLGFSLISLNPTVASTNDSLATSWRPSNFENGSPGTPESALAPPAGAVLINEALTNTASATGDRIELRNTTAVGINLQHWYVSDDETNVRKFRFTAPTILPANGYLVVGKTQLGASFDLSNLGGRLIVQAANSGGQLLGYRDDRQFDGADADATLGRVVNSVGDVDFVPLVSATLGTANAAAVVGPIVINEIMYHPRNELNPLDEDEYIELYNTSAGAVPLYDPANPANTWQVSGIGDIFIPLGVSIPGNGFLILTSANPAYFRDRYNVPAEVEIYQFSGALANSGETIDLLRPTTPGPGGVPYVLADHVSYTDLAPWPTLADGDGASLSRFSASALGNEPDNWLPSTLGGTPGRTNTYYDTTPPSIPANVTAASAGPARIDLTWTASIDVQSAVLRYNIYRNGELVGTSAANSYSDTTVAAGEAYSYEVSSVNLDLAESAKSAVTAPVTILAATAVVAPREHTVRVVFSETVTPASAQNAANYALDGGLQVVGASLGANGRTVILTTSSITGETQYALTISNISAVAGHSLAPNSVHTFTLSGQLEQFDVRHVTSSGAPIGNLAAADALLGLPPGNPGIGSEMHSRPTMIDYKDDDGTSDAGRFPTNAAFPINTVGNNDDFALRATGTIVVPPGQAGLWTFATGIIGPQITLITEGDTWKYLDNGSDQGTAWRATGFGDASWGSGKAELGYGNGDEQTVVSFGPNSGAKYITTYFRKSFNVADPSSIVALNLRVRRDDGVAIYLNGTEVVRSNLAAGATYTTVATANADNNGADWLPFSIPANLLVAGNNVIAAEIHQSSGTSSDISFDLSLVAETELPQAPPPTTVILPRGSSWKFLDNGSNQGTAWRSEGFSDAAWVSGNAPLGYGEAAGVNTTTLSFGPNTNDKYPTTYFRKTFEVADASGYSTLKFRVRRDDGVAIYLNGVEIIRDGLNAGAGYLDYATITVGDTAETTYYEFDVNPSLLVNGTNVIAAEVHQVNATSSDLTFDLEIAAGGAMSDDGARLVIDGVPVFVADVGLARTNRYGTVNLAEGEHEIDLTFFERSGGAQLELFAAPGSHVAFGSTFRRVGDVAAGGLAVFSPGTPPNESPLVIDVLAASSTWSAEYLAALATAGIGQGGVSLARGALQLAPVAWNNLDQVKIRFSDDMLVSADDLSLRGVNVADYIATVGLASNGFSYDAATRTATWTFNQPFAADKLLVQLDDSATDTLGASLDGEWTNATSTFSGNGTAGGDFSFRFNILPGDVNGSGQVTAADVQANRAAQFRGLGHPQFNPRHDVDGSGHVNATDLVLVRDFSLGSLPAGEPTPGGSPAAAAGAVVATANSREASSNSTTVRAARTRVALAGTSTRSITAKIATNNASSPSESTQSLRARRSGPVRARHDAALESWS